MRASLRCLLLRHNVVRSRGCFEHYQGRFSRGCIPLETNGGTLPTSGHAGTAISGTPRNACTRRPHRCPCGTLESRVTPMASPWPDLETTRHRRVQEANPRTAPRCVELHHKWPCPVTRTRHDAGTSACAGRGHRSKKHPNMTSKFEGARAQHRSTSRLDSSPGPAESMMRVQDRGEPDGRPHRRCEGPSSGHQESS